MRVIIIKTINSKHYDHIIKHKGPGSCFHGTQSLVGNDRHLINYYKNNCEWPSLGELRECAPGELPSKKTEAAKGGGKRKENDFLFPGGGTGRRGLQMLTITVPGARESMNGQTGVLNPMLSDSRVQVLSTAIHDPLCFKSEEGSPQRGPNSQW